MKLLRSIVSYTRGIRLALLALTLMMTVALLMGIIVVSQVRYIRHNYEVVSGSTGDLDRLYYYMRMDVDFGGTGTNQLMETIESYPALEGVYLVSSVGPISYTVEGRKKSVTIELMDPRLLELFPDMDLEFMDQDGVLLASPRFQEVNVGDSFDLYFSNVSQSETFTAAGRIQYPYYAMALGGGSTLATVNDMFGRGQRLVMLATQENIARLSELANIRPGTNFVFEVSEAATDEQVEALLLEISRTGIAEPLRTMLERTEEEMDKQLRDLLPMPLFLFTVSTFAYFSTLILILKKKEQDLAISYLCGGKRWQCALTVLGSFGLVSLIPFGVSIGALALLPAFDWLQAMTIINYLIDEWSYGMLWGFVILSLFISGLATWLEMKDHTPLTLLRGVEK